METVVTLSTQEISLFRINQSLLIRQGAFFINSLIYIMKHLVLLTLTALLLSFNGLAQLDYGVYGGLNFSNLKITPELDPPKPKMLLGFHLGGFARYDLGNSIFLQPEVEFSTQGANDEDGGDFEKIRLSYINITGLAGYAINDQFTVFFGPRIGILASGKFIEEDKTDGQIKEYNAKSLYSSSDFGLNFGVGYKLNSGLGINLRYNFGLTDNNDDPTEEAFYEINQSIQSRTIQLGITYQL